MRLLPLRCSSAAWCLLLHFLAAWGRQFRSHDEVKQLALSHAINESFVGLTRVGLKVNRHNVTGRSALHDACHGLHGQPGELGRIGCCQPQDVRVLYNVVLDGASLVYFDDGRSALPPLPVIRLVRRHNEAPALFSMTLRRAPQARFAEQCADSDAFDGTLHVFGRAITHNVYHTTVDNFLPLAAQIAQDALLASPFLHKPRVFLASLLGGADPLLPPTNASSPSFSSSTPHTQLLSLLFSGGAATLADLQGMCFRRVVWNAGVRALYHNTLQPLRRAVCDFSRALVLRAYPVLLQPPEALRGPPASGSGLRIALYTRGASGQGRSLANETGLVQALRGMGHRAAICCDYGAADSMLSQIAHAVHADVVVGLHGAALVHAVFSPRGVRVLELKSAYGFSSSLFALVTDSRVGSHCHLDIRAYATARGHRPIDAPLTLRIARLLPLPPSSHGTSSLDFCLPPDPDASPPALLSHPLGPPIEAVRRVCRSMALSRYQAALEAREQSDELHCANACRIYAKDPY